MKKETPKKRREEMARVFPQAIIDQANANLTNKGLDRADVKDVLVVMAGHFNEEVEEIRGSLTQFKKIGSKINAALWAVAISIFGSMVVALIIAMLALKK